MATINAITDSNYLATVYFNTTNKEIRYRVVFRKITVEKFTVKKGSKTYQTTILKPGIWFSARAEKMVQNLIRGTGAMLYDSTQSALRKKVLRHIEKNTLTEQQKIQLLDEIEQYLRTVNNDVLKKVRDILQSD